MVDPDQSLGKLEEIPLAEYWPHEERDFTPWLAENISRLEDNELLGLTLEVQDREVHVGRYYADIHATDVNSERDIIIENQYGTLDHRHLGKALLYAGNIPGDIVVWIAEQFEDTHLNTIQWLNELAGREVGFFAIEARLVRIDDDSTPALDFTLVERPQNWRSQPEELTETEREHLEFWERYEKRLEDRGLTEYISDRSLQPSASYRNTLIDSGDAYIRLAATTRGKLECSLRIEDESGNFGGLDPDAVTEALSAAHSELEDAAVSAAEIKAIEWDSRSGNLYDHVRLQRSDSVDREDESRWETYHDWLIDATRLYADVFCDRGETSLTDFKADIDTDPVDDSADLTDV